VVPNLEHLAPALGAFAAIAEETLPMRQIDRRIEKALFTGGKFSAPDSLNLGSNMSRLVWVPIW
jgi:hypothetical protein